MRNLRNATGITFFILAIVLYFVIAEGKEGLRYLSGRDQESNTYQKIEIAGKTFNFEANKNEDNCPSEFLIGAFSVGCGANNVMNTLGLNIWHRFIWQEGTTYGNYNQKIFPTGFLPEDKLFSPLNSYKNSAIEYYNSVSRLNNNYLYLTRPKIEMLSFAQRSDYTPCDIPIHSSSEKGYWWYGYDIHETGSDEFDGKKWIRVCETGKDNAGYVVKNLRPVLEQSNESVPNGFFNDALYSWYVKPKVMIDETAQDTTPVFRVDIIRKDGSLFRSVTVRRKNFDEGGTYKKGEYRDLFFPDNDLNPLFIKNGAELYGDSPDGNRPKNDYAIWWFGTCNMKIERIRVENNIARDLFSGKFETEDNNWIKWETDIATANGVNGYKFLVDEADHSMYPAIKYLNEKIRAYKPAGSCISLTAINNIVYNTPFIREREGKPWMWNEPLPLDVVKKEFGESGMTEVFTDLYPIYADRFWWKDVGRRSSVPNTLPVSDYSVKEGRLGEPTDPENYEDNLNLNLEDSYHRYFRFMEYSRSISSDFNVPLIAAIQIHSWYNGTEAAYSLREPTNEEIEMLAGIAITYGAKGIIYHAYNSIGELGNNMYSRGLIGNGNEPVTESTQCDDNHRRLYNAYGQKKWDKIIQLSSKLKLLGKEIIKFDNHKTKSYRINISEDRNELFRNTFIQDLTAFRRGTDAPLCKTTNVPEGMTYDCPDKTYIQLGIFRDKNGGLYFMLVNRRTSPINGSDYDGRRFIRIQIKTNAPEFEGYSKWKIINSETGTITGTFESGGNIFINPGWIMPGEMILYKIVPLEN